jgi:hypothetical protein
MQRKEAQSSLFDYVSSDETLEEMVLQIAQDADPTFTVDDLHTERVIALIDRSHRDHRVLGAVLASLKKKGHIIECGYVKSTRDECHNRPVMRWKLRRSETS